MHDLIHCWRHPKPKAVEGVCVGRLDVEVDPRRVRRLASTIDRFARQHRLERIVITSPLRRCAAVGRSLARAGWIHRVCDELIECDFGRWEGHPWQSIDIDALRAWDRDFAHARAHGGETVDELLRRVQACRPDASILVGHAGWMCALRWLHDQKDGDAPRPLPRADQWPRSPAYGHRWSFPAPPVPRDLPAPPAPTQCTQGSP